MGSILNIWFIRGRKRQVATADDALNARNLPPASIINLVSVTLIVTFCPLHIFYGADSVFVSLKKIYFQTAWNTNTQAFFPTLSLLQTNVDKWQYYIAKCSHTAVRGLKSVVRKDVPVLLEDETTLARS